MKIKNLFENACRNKIKIDLPRTTYSNGTRYFDINECWGTVNPVTIWNLKDDKLESIYNLYMNRLDKLTKPQNSLFENTNKEDNKKSEYEMIIEIVKVVVKRKRDEKAKTAKRLKAEKRLKDLIYARENAEREKLLNMSVEEIKNEIKALEKSLGK